MSEKLEKLRREYNEYMTYAGLLIDKCQEDNDRARKEYETAMKIRERSKQFVDEIFSIGESDNG
mgnify:CR=1 FL=1